MKKYLPVFLSISILIAFSSCSMEKRTYRNGWYIDKSSSSSIVQEPNAKNADDAVGFSDKEKTSVQHHSKESSVADSSANKQPEKTAEILRSDDPIREVINKVRNK